MTKPGPCTMVATYVGWAMMVCIVVATYVGWAMMLLDHVATQGTAVHTPATLEVGGDVRTPLSLTPSELKAMPRTRIEVKNDDGRTVTYEGVLVGELLKRSGAPLGQELRGNALAAYVVASAADGYQVLFSLAELDPAMTPNDVIVADTTDGKPLVASQGPLRIVAPGDARPARSVRMLERLEVVRLKK